MTLVALYCVYLYFSIFCCTFVVFFRWFSIFQRSLKASITCDGWSDLILNSLTLSFSLSYTHSLFQCLISATWVLDRSPWWRSSRCFLFHGWSWHCHEWASVIDWWNNDYVLFHLFLGKFNLLMCLLTFFLLVGVIILILLFSKALLKIIYLTEPCSEVLILWHLITFSVTCSVYLLSYSYISLFFLS